MQGAIKEEMQRWLLEMSGKSQEWPEVAHCEVGYLLLLCRDQCQT